MVICPRPSPKPHKQGDLCYSFSLLLIELAFDLFRVKQNKSKRFYPMENAAISTTQHHPIAYCTPVN